jgi:hypothetical protein
MKEKRVLVSRGVVYIFESDMFEPRERFIKRCWFCIGRIEGGSDRPIEEIMVDSRVWMNEQVLGAVY